jgi:hypothetical protein
MHNMALFDPLPASIIENASYDTLDDQQHKKCVTFVHVRSVTHSDTIGSCDTM